MFSLLFPLSLAVSSLAAPLASSQSGLNILRLEPVARRSGLHKRQSGINEPLLDATGQDTRYVGNITIGTPPQDFVILFDTESGDLWVNGPDSNTTTKKKLDTSSSSTFTAQNLAFTDGYVGGSVSGNLGEDTVCIGGQCVDSQVFGLVNVTQPVWEGDAMDGIMGVPAAGKTYNGANSWWASYFAANPSLTPVLGFYAVRAGNVDPKGQYTGQSLPGAEVCIGCTDSSKYTGDLTTVTLQDHNDWRVPMDGIYVNGSLVEGTGGSNLTVDTGNPSGGWPNYIGVAAYGALGGTVNSTDQSIHIPCDTFRASTFAIGLGGAQFKIDVGDLISQNSDGTCGSKWGVGAADSTGGSGAGTLFLKNVYTAFSYERDYSMQFAQGVPAPSIDS